MRACVQRVSRASVTVEGEVVGRIDRGLLVLLGVEDGDAERDVDYLAEKTMNLRIFEDADGKMNLSLLDVAGEMLVVSQFTLLGDCRKGRRPSFVKAARPDAGNRFYQAFCAAVSSAGVTVATGKFQAQMEVHLVNDGPVTLLLDSRRSF